MKTRITSLIITVMLLSATAAGQNLDDALRYSRLTYHGSARFNAMGGAFTALGGDISALQLNPAGAALFRSTEFSITPMVSFRELSTNYRGSITDGNQSQLALGQVGVASVMKTGSVSGLTSLTIAYTFNNNNNLSRYGHIDGISNNGSIADYWALQANGHFKDELPDLPWMAWETWLIDTLPFYRDRYGSIFSYYGEREPVYGQSVRRKIDDSGYNRDNNITIGANLGDKLYLGAGLSWSKFNFTGHLEHRETDDKEIIYDFISLTYTDHFNAEGAGLNFKVGAIIRPVESLRVGIGFTTPTTYKFNEVYWSSLTARLEGDPLYPVNNPSAELKDARYSYRITTPYRINAGIAYQIGSFGLISADYEFVDYSSARLHHGLQDYDFYYENEDIRSETRSTGNLRVGAELRSGPLYLRGGYNLFGSPFKPGTLNEKASRNGFSAGAGYRMEKFYLDLALTVVTGTEVYMMYPEDYGDIPYYRSDPANLKATGKYLSVTMGLKF